MCGIAGVFDPGAGLDERSLCAVADGMASTLEHRGPDAAGAWSDPAHGVGLGFRRLAIVDLSSAGHQPMASASGRYVLVFNGEVYDHRDHRVALEAGGHRFRGTSDTEVLLALIDERGVEAALGRTDLMGGLAVWDRQEASLTLARDRLGEKPLLWGWAGRAMVFGSELKALRAHHAFDAALDPAAVASYFRLTYVPHPASIVRDARHLPPGSMLTVTAEDVVRRRVPTPRRWWSLADVAAQGAGRRAGPADRDAAAAEVDALLRTSVARRQQADVPVGAFLSGGVDSSAVVALLRATGSDVRSYCVSMPEVGLDESAAAAAVARHLGTTHTTLELSLADALEVVPTLPVMYDEPFADPSALPTHLVARAARREVTVALTGDGGDEVFGGYNRHVLGPSTWRRGSRLPRPIRHALAAGVQRVPPSSWDRWGDRVPARFRVANAGDKVGKLASMLGADDDVDVARLLLTTWEPSEVLAEPHDESTTVLDGDVPAGLDPYERMLYIDTVMGLPDGMLVKVDRASMSASLEVRAPLLAPSLVEAVWRMPRRVRIDGGRGKLVLRDVLRRHVPDELIDRPKLGFDPPIGAWLRGPLRGWADGLLAPDRIAAGGFLDPAPVRARWQEHLEGARRWDYALWTVLCFLGWYESWTS